MKYIKKDTQEVIVEAVQFDGEKWLYERKTAYKMVYSAPCDTGKGIFGFSYRPQIVTLDDHLIVNHGDYILLKEDNNFAVCSREEFELNYQVIE